MNDPAEREQLLAALFSEDESARAASLDHAIGALRRTRARKRARRFLGGTVAVAVGGVLFLLQAQHRNKVERETVKSAPEHPAVRIEIVNDEELLAQFPGRAVALVGPSSNRQLIFLDPR